MHVLPSAQRCGGSAPEFSRLRGIAARPGDACMQTSSAYLRRATCLCAALLWLAACGGGDNSGDGDREQNGRSPRTPNGPGGETQEPGQQPSAAPTVPTKTDPCFTAEQSFAWEMYGSVFSRCIGCHNSFGLARQVGVALKLT